MNHTMPNKTQRGRLLGLVYLCQNEAIISQAGDSSPGHGTRTPT